MLKVMRFCGVELYPLSHAKWYVSGNTMWINMSFSEGIDLHKDTEFLAQEPTWELSFKINSENEIKSGVIFENANESDEDAVFYYCEHTPTYKNRIEIVERQNDNIFVRISGECCDINYYDGSKGNDILEITAWINKK